MAFGFFSVLKRNFTIMWNSKLTFFIILFGPLFLVIIMGFALQDNTLRDIHATVYSHERNTPDDSFTQGFIQKLKSKSFIVYETDSLYKCKNDVINSRSHVCIEIIKKIGPERAGLKSESYEVRNHLDLSKSRVAGGIIVSVQQVVEEYTKEIMTDKFLETKSRINEVMEDVRQKRDDLNIVINEIDELEFQLGTIEKKVVDLENNVNSLIYEIEILQSQLDNLLDYIDSAEDYNPFTYNEINDLRNSLIKLKSKLSLVQSQLSGLFISQDIENAKRSVSSLKRELIDVRDGLNQILYEWEMIKEINLEDIVDYIKFSYQSVTERSDLGGGQKFQFLDYLFPSFLMFFMIFSSLVISAVIIMRERLSNALIRNLASKTSGFSLNLGNFINIVFILMFQVLIIILTSMYFLNINLLDYLIFILFFALIDVILFSMLGMFLGYIFNTQESALISSVSLSLLFFIFLPVITPTETLPDFIGSIISLAPFVILESKLRMVTIFGIIPSFSGMEIISLLISFSFVFLLIWIFYSKSKRKEI
jgi:predicted  nucleic acid-binding Zn-ribbon protein